MSRASGQYLTYANGATSPGYQGLQPLFGPISQAMRGAAARVNDTGSINPNTSTTGAAGYEIFAFSDALQATKPIYVRLDYAGNVTAPTINFTVGTTWTNGGAIGGITTPSLSALNNATTYTTASPRNVYAATGDGSFMTLIMNIQPTAPAAMDAISGFVIERTRDADGTANGNGFTIWRWSNTADFSTGPNVSYYAGSISRVYDTSAAAVQNTTTNVDYNAVVPNLLNLPSTGVLTYANDTAQAYPVFTYAGPQPQGASKALALTYQVDVPRAGLVSLTQYGTPGTWLTMGLGTNAFVSYLSTGPTATTSAFRFAQYTALSPAFRWE